MLKDELKHMKRALRRLGHTEEDVVQLKGRAACEVSTADELLITELMFNVSPQSNSNQPGITVFLYFLGRLQRT